MSQTVFLIMAFLFAAIGVFFLDGERETQALVWATLLTVLAYH